MLKRHFSGNESDCKAIFETLSCFCCQRMWSKSKNSCMLSCGHVQCGDCAALVMPLAVRSRRRMVVIQCSCGIRTEMCRKCDGRFDLPLASVALASPLLAFDAMGLGQLVKLDLLWGCSRRWDAYLPVTNTVADLKDYICEQKTTFNRRNMSLVVHYLDETFSLDDDLKTLASYGVNRLSARFASVQVCFSRGWNGHGGVSTTIPQTSTDATGMVAGMCSAGGRLLLAVPSKGVIRVLDATTHDLQFEIDLKSNVCKPSLICASSDGRVFVASECDMHVAVFRACADSDTDTANPCADPGTQPAPADKRVRKLNLSHLKGRGIGGLCVSPCGTQLVVTCTNTHVVFVVNALTGALLYSIGERGCNRGEFNCPRGVCVSASGELFVADSGNNRVQVFRVDRATERFGFARTINAAGHFQQPWHVCLTPENAFVCVSAKAELVSPPGAVEMCVCIVAADADSDAGINLKIEDRNTAGTTVEPLDNPANFFKIRVSSETRGVHAFAVAGSEDEAAILLTSHERGAVLVRDFFLR